MAIYFFQFVSGGLPLGTGDGTKTDEFLEKFQMAFDPSSFSENHIAIVLRKTRFKALCKGPKSAIQFFIQILLATFKFFSTF